MAKKQKEEKMKAGEIISSMDSFFIEHFDRDAKFATFALSLAEVASAGDEDQLCGLVDPLLSLGFIVGQLFEVTDPEILEKIEAMKRLIRSKGLLPFLPRERKVEATLTK